MGISLITDYILGELFWLPSFMVAILFFLFMLISWLSRYNILFTPVSERKIIHNFALWYERTSYKLSMLFPPLLPPLRLDHLKRWPEVRKFIDEEMLNFLKSLEESQALSRLGLLL